MIVAILHGIYYAFKTPLKPGTKSYISQNKLENFIKEQIIINNKLSLTTIVASNYAAFPHLSTINGGAGLLKTDVLNSGNLVATEPCILLLIIQANHLPYYKDFIINSKVHLQQKFDDFYCYRYNLSE